MTTRSYALDGADVAVPTPFPWRRLAGAVALAAVGTAAVNALIYFAAGALGAFPETVLIDGVSPLTLAPVLVSSAIAAVAGGALFAALLRFTRRPVRVFLWVSAVALLASLAGPFGIPGAPMVMIVALNAMHLAAAAVIVPVLVRVVDGRRPAN